MFLPSPPVDNRSRDDIAAATAALVRAYTANPAVPGSGWTPPSDQPDVASALIHVFAVMAKYAVDRVNLFPDKAFLAFLDMIGVQRSPRRPAEVPLTFSLAKGTSAGVLVPAGTQVGAQPEAGDMGPVGFETVQDLVVTPAQLVAVLSYQPSGDLYADRTPLATGASTGSYPAFDDRLATLGGGLSPIEHGLYLSADTILTLPAGVVITMKITLAPGAGAEAWPALGLAWSYWSAAGAWQTLALTPGASALEWSFTVPADMAATTVNGQSARWIRAQLHAWPAPPASIPALQKVTLTSAPVTRSGITPDAVMSSAGTIDPSAGFYPFGEQPRRNDVFYLASAALGTPGAAVTLHLNPSALSLTKESIAPLLVWEVSTETGWTELGRSTKASASAASSTYGFSDGTRALTVATGLVTFTLPANVAPTTVQGTTRVWLRIRLLGEDNYGMGLVLAAGTGGVPTVTYEPWQPPLLASPTFDSTTVTTAAASGFTYNDMSFASVGGAGASSFIPFVRRTDTEPALYLGFDQPFENRPVLLYVQVAPLSVEDLESLGDTTSSPTLAWEYASPSGWAPLGASDETRALTESGLLSFVGPVDFTSSTVLGQRLYWIRVRLREGAFAAPPRVGRVLTNTVWASHTTTIQTEVMGSSDGVPGQTFSLLHTPVLQGERIHVREPDLPPAGEQAAIGADEGRDAILVVPGLRGQPDQIWVRWHEVTDFYASGPRDRHYRIDRDTGLVRFGDGLRGMVPPKGVQNVWCFFYQSGGGAQGNRAAGTITQLMNGLASIAGVTNHEAASGGADAQTLDQLKALGPTFLRNRGRAIAAQDYEDLALEASASVARVRLLSPSFDPIEEAQSPLTPTDAGALTLLVVPFSDEMPPTPGLGLIHDLESYLSTRIAPAVSLTITGPLWVRVSVVGLTIVPVSATGADALRAAAVTAITAFLHPLTGGFDGAGWAIGHLPQASDIYRLVMGIAGVDAVRGFTVAIDPTLDLTDSAIANRISIYSGTHTVVITAPDAGG
ncbi:hypothetical protein A7982_13681 [Minicystis rosea]|nr:hypothetical protein A7982_13681 [Minicystis rosea]